MKHAKNEFCLTLANLPARDTERWTTIRKIFVVRAVAAGLLTFDQASKRYNLSFEEFVGWRTLAANFSRSVYKSRVGRALRAHPLWVGSDHDINQAPLEEDSSQAFQLD